MLSATKDLGLANEILRFAQDDTSGGISWKPRKADESAVCTINRHLRVGIIRPGETPQYEDTSANALCDAINQVTI